MVHFQFHSQASIQLKKYTYYLVAENSNMDVSDSRAVTFTTKARVLTADDFTDCR